MIAFPILAGLSSEPFSGDEAVNGIVADPSHGDGPGRVRVEEIAEAMSKGQEVQVTPEKVREIGRASCRERV